MTLKEYINTHPEQFKDDIDKWLFLKFGIIGGCCSAEKSHEYHIARMVAEKLTDTFIEKAEKAMIEWAGTYVSKTTGGGVRERKVLATDLLNYFKKYIRGE